MLACSIKEASKELGICQRLVRELVREGKVRSVKIGGRIVIPRTELERLLAPPSSTFGEIPQGRFAEAS